MFFGCIEMTAIERLQQQSDRQKINAWLDHIQEFDKATRDEILKMCASDIEARKYYVKRYNEDCAT